MCAFSLVYLVSSFCILIINAGRHGLNGEGEPVQRNVLRVAPNKYLPPSKSIAVIGAGPAGLHITRELQKRGFKNVKIFERTDRIGGKSFTRYMNGNDQPCTQRRIENGRVVFDKDCIAIEYGTCFLHTGYHKVRELIHEYGIRREAPSGSVVVSSKGFDFVRQLDSEIEDVLRRYEANDGQISLEMINAVQDHLEQLQETQVARAEDFAHGTIEKVREDISEVLFTVKDGHFNNSAAKKNSLRNGLYAVALDVYEAMNKSSYDSIGSGSLVMEVTKQVMAGEKMRGRDDFGLKEPKLTLSLTADDLDVYLHVANCIIRYCELRKEIFGNPKFHMPGRLNDSQLKELSIPFREWMVNNGLQAMVPFFQVAHAAQGYGYLWEVPTYYGLSWMSPDFVFGILSISAAALPKEIKEMLFDALDVPGDRYDYLKYATTMLPEGYNSLWREMHKVMTTENNGVDLVEYDVSDLTIDRHLDDNEAPITISWTDVEGKSRAEQYDFLIYTGPLKYMSRYMPDVQSDEQNIFDILEAYTFAVTVYRVNTHSNPIDGYSNPSQDSKEQWWKRHAKPATLYNADNIVDQPRSDFTHYVDRNDPFQWAGDNELARSYVPHQRRIAGQFAGHEVHLDVDGTSGERLAWWGNGSFGSGGMQGESIDKLKAWLLQKLQMDLRKRGVDDITVLEQVPWPYFWHFNGDAIAAGKPWDLLDLQGTKKTWYLGASSSMESVNDIVNYNLMMLDKSAFDGFNLFHTDEHSVNKVRQDLDAFADPASQCCCDPEGICALVPPDWQVPTFLSTLAAEGWLSPELQADACDLLGSMCRNVCPDVRVSHWPMSAEKEKTLREAGHFFQTSINNINEDAMELMRSQNGCNNYEDVVVLTVEAYPSQSADCDEYSDRRCQWIPSHWNATLDCFMGARCESRIVEDCGSPPEPDARGCMHVGDDWLLSFAHHFTVFSNVAMSAIMWNLLQ